MIQHDTATTYSLKHLVADEKHTISPSSTSTSSHSSTKKSSSNSSSQHFDDIRLTPLSATSPSSTTIIDLPNDTLILEDYCIVQSQNDGWELID
jgi:Ulp1 family protease